MPEPMNMHFIWSKGPCSCETWSYAGWFGSRIPFLGKESESESQEESTTKEGQVSMMGLKDGEGITTQRMHIISKSKKTEPFQSFQERTALPVPWLQCGQRPSDRKTVIFWHFKPPHSVTICWKGHRKFTQLFQWLYVFLTSLLSLLSSMALKNLENFCLKYSPTTRTKHFKFKFL